jgi:HSP20 family molecular chaperone IbpA
MEVKEATPTVPATSSPGWDPFAEFESRARRFGHRPMMMLWPNPLSTFDGVDCTPPADIEETGTAWTIEAELPGVEKKDIEAKPTVGWPRRTGIDPSKEMDLLL